jgi:hypothetical protein
MLQTEFEFTLPRGYVDAKGDLHRQGVMRLATAVDEVDPLQDARFHANEAYLSILLLSRVIVRIGEISTVTPSVIEKLFASDFAYLQALYLSMNDGGGDLVETQCPTCGKRFALSLLAQESNAH